MFNANGAYSNKNNNQNKSYEDEFAKAVRLSQQTYEKEQELRKLAKKFEEQIEKKQVSQKQKWNGKQTFSTMISCMKWKPMFVNRGIGSGIQNLGNSCFMNATLQCLAYTPPLAQLAIQSNHSSQCKSKKFCTLCEMEKVISLMLMGKQICKPRYLFRNLPAINDLLTPGCQEDAHEFIQSLLDKMELAHDDTYKQSKKMKKNDPNNPIRTLFTGSTKTTITCGKCKRKSVTTEPFCVISLEVDDQIDLCESLEIFSQDELMRGDDKYFCDPCKRKCIAHKRLTINKLPPILALHFKRFAVQFEAQHHRQGTMKKLAYHVQFPCNLDFASHALKHVINEEDQNKELQDANYELYAVLVHSGPQLGYGHYYALVKSPDGYWFRMNDMDVIPVNLKHVLKEQAYIVFYRKKGNDLGLKEHLNNLAGNVNDDLNEKNNELNCKDSMAMANDDYFAQACNDNSSSPVIVDGVGLGLRNGKDDRKQYVQVPPMTMRPAMVGNNDNGNDHENDGINHNQRFQEVFWAPKEPETHTYL